MATDPMFPLKPAFDLLDRVLDEQEAVRLQILREAAPDVHVATDDGGAACAIHDPNQADIFGAAPIVQHSSGTVGRVEEITHALECGDSAWLGQLIATLEHENNALRALLMMSDRFTAVLRDRVEALESRVSLHAAHLPV